MAGKFQVVRLHAAVACDHCTTARAVWVRISPAGKRTHFCAADWRAFRYRTWKRPMATDANPTQRRAPAPDCSAKSPERLPYKDE